MCHYFPEISLPAPFNTIVKNLNLGVALMALAANIAYFRVDFFTAIVYLIWSNAEVFAS